MRALSSLVQFRFKEALGYNAAFVLSLPFLVALLIRMVYFYIKEGNKLKPMKWDTPLAITAFLVAFLFAVARNLAMFSFLAP